MWHDTEPKLQQENITESGKRIIPKNMKKRNNKWAFMFICYFSFIFFFFFCVEEINHVIHSMATRVAIHANKYNSQCMQI